MWPDCVMTGNSRVSSFVRRLFRLQSWTFRACYHNALLWYIHHKWNKRCMCSMHVGIVRHIIRHQTTIRILRTIQHSSQADRQPCHTICGTINKRWEAIAYISMVCHTTVHYDVYGQKFRRYLMRGDWDSTQGSTHMKNTKQNLKRVSIYLFIFGH